MTPTVRGIVFDLDGTLIDSVADITQAMNRAFAGLSLPPLTEAQVEPALGHGALELVRACVRAVAPQRADDELVVAAHDAYLAAYASDPAPYTRLHADAGTALPALREAGIALGVCTNKETGLSWEVLEAVGLAELMSAVRGIDSTAHPKPDPRHLLETASDIAVAGEDLVYVGDTPVDVAVARGAGVRYRHVAWGTPVGDGVTRLERFAELLGQRDEAVR